MRKLHLGGLKRIPPEIADYLKSPIPLSPIALVLATGLLYQLLTQPSAAAALVVPLLVLAMLLALLRAPGWLLYLCLFMALAVHLHFFTQVLALAPARFGSTRDRAAIATALALLRGQNPWNHTPQIPVPATTGAASILLVLPAVRIFGNLALLTYLFWLGVFGFIVVCDVKYRNRIFPPLALLTMTGMLGFAHAMEWRMEELYFPYVFMLLAYYFLKRKRLFLCGLFLAIPPLSRVSYSFMTVGFLLWYAFDQRPILLNFVRLGAGALLTVVAILTPFVIVGRTEFWAHNFYTITKDMVQLSTWPTTNYAFQVMNRLTAGMSPAAIRLFKQILALLMLVGMAWGARRWRFSHPFWHVAVAAFLSHTIVWHCPLPLDYALIFVLPAYFAAALTRAPSPHSPAFVVDGGSGKEA
jgi:hypothetical protein